MLWQRSGVRSGDYPHSCVFGMILNVRQIIPPLCCGEQSKRAVTLSVQALRVSLFGGSVQACANGSSKSSTMYRCWASAWDSRRWRQCTGLPSAMLRTQCMGACQACSTMGTTSLLASLRVRPRPQHQRVSVTDNGALAIRWTEYCPSAASTKGGWPASPYKFGDFAGVSL